MNNYLSYSHWIGKFTDNELTPEEEESILSQASHNPVLRNELRLDRELSLMFDDGMRLRLSEQIRKTMKEEQGKIRFPFYLKIAASILVLLALTGTTYLIARYNYVSYSNMYNISRPFSMQRIQGFLGFGSEKEKLTYSPAGRREVIQDEQSVNMYTPRPEYEYLVGSVTRDVSLYVISPGPRVSCKSDSLLQFSWRWLSGIVPVILEVCDNRGKVILKNVHTNDVSYILNTSKLGRGLYYYKITTGEDIVTIGSITVY